MFKQSIALVILSLSLVFRLAAQEKLQYHIIQKDKDGNIIPWYNPDPAKSYDHMLRLVWNFWDTMRVDMNGIPYYMNHQVWRPGVNDPRGMGGDQISMALSAWRLYYQYTGNERVKENMKFMADYYLSHGLSPANANWPGIPFPYNTMIYSGIFDGDMIIGKDYTQPDKAGSFGYELLQLYKMMNREQYPGTAQERYLAAAVTIANTLASHITDGDENNSPMPFKVNAYTGEVGILKNNREGSSVTKSSYTTNWSGTMELFIELQKLGVGETSAYKKGFDKLLEWMKKYPVQNNKWGPFFEDVPGWSDTQINAITFARFMMDHPEYFPGWQQDIREIFDWVYENLGNTNWKKYGVTVINEQTAYKQPGNSHSSRQASTELQYMALTGDKSRNTNAIRQLNWATYMVDNDGKNKYLHDEIWMTDGYGDFSRHYLRAMAAMPELAPGDADHFLSTTSVVQHMFYKDHLDKYYFPSIGDYSKVEIHYVVFDEAGTDVIRLAKKPGGVLFDKVPAKENDKVNGYEWKPLAKGGVLTIRRTNTKVVTVLR